MFPDSRGEVAQSHDRLDHSLHTTNLVRGLLRQLLRKARLKAQWYVLQTRGPVGEGADRDEELHHLQCRGEGLEEE